MGLNGLDSPHSPMPVPPNNTPVVTPEDSLEDMSLDQPIRNGNMHQEDEQPRHVILREVPRGRVHALRPQSANHSLAPPAVLRPSSFEIMGCFTPVYQEHSAGPGIRYAGNPGASRHHGAHYGFNRTLTPYPYQERAALAAMMSAGARRVWVVPYLEATAGANQNCVQRDSIFSRQSSPERYSTKKLVVFICAASSILAGFILMVHSIWLITVFRVADTPVDSGYIVECVFGTIIFVSSTAGMALVLTGKRIVFPFTLRSPFARRLPPQPKELELDNFSRLASVMNQDVERGGGGGVQQQVFIQQAVHGPIRGGPAESREQLIQAAASGATVARSNTHTSSIA